MEAGGRSESFYEQVYALVRRVPPGRVMTYGQVALELGAPAAARAVGYALHSLPANNDVPWWRIVNARGAVSLKGRGAQADLQRQLLEAEGVVFDPEERTDLARHRWWPGGEVSGEK